MRSVTKVFAFVLAMAVFYSVSVYPQERLTPAGEGGKITLGSRMTVGELLGYIGDREKKPIIYVDVAIPKEEIFIIPPKDPVPLDKFLSMVDTLLRMKNVVMVPGPDAIRVMRATDVKEFTSVRPATEADTVPDTDQVITQIIGLKYLDANIAKSVIDQIRGKDSTQAQMSVVPSPDINSLIITDFGLNVKRYYEVLKQLDIEAAPSYQHSLRILKYAGAGAVKAALDHYINTILPPVIKPRAAQLPKPVVYADEKNNSVLIIAQDRDIQMLLKVVDTMDTEAAQKSVSVYTYKLINTTADDVSKIVLEAFKQVQSRRPQETISVQTEKSTNSLIIVCSPQVYDEMLILITKLDAKKRQVSIEAAIGEMSYDKMIELGIELASLKVPKEGELSGFGATTHGISVLKADGSKVPIPPTLGGMTIGLWKDKVDSIPFLMSASQKDSDVKVKSAPSVMVNDNAEATITISEQVPYDTRTIGPDGTVTGITFGGYLDASIKLKITPHISDDYLRLELDQSVEEFVQRGSSETRPGKISRSTKTTITIPDKNTVAIGGMKKEYKTQSVSKTPILGDIPILNIFFRKTTDVVTEKYLWIFIRPEIIHEFSDLIEKTQQEQSKIDALDKTVPKKDSKKDKDK